jgi:hypothetical protein
MSVESEIRDHSDRLNLLLEKYGDKIEEYNAMVHAARSNPDILPADLPTVLDGLYHQYNTPIFIGLEAVRLIDELGKSLSRRGSLIKEHNAKIPREHPMLTNPDESFGWLDMIQDETYDVSGKFSLKDKEKARSMIKQIEDLQKQREGKL